ncbi:hypothetical protein CYY_002355 [Polysphondylium violaceum]|uniref:Uncharacterized protein n=1 Tax=Polysphondylium violaceum TaxID=133409 RepID=A0A8J4V9Q2_9MYCE|nr:hypothetical protein CYY_002355 [Polysphondylium violaceum]
MASNVRVVVWVESNSTIVGEFEYISNATTLQASPKLTINNVIYDTQSGYQTSSFNYVTKQLTFMARDSNDNSRVSFITVDCIQWRVVATHSVENGISWLGLQYDQTNNQNNLLAVGESGDMLCVSRFNPISGESSIISKLQGKFHGTAFIKNTQYLYVTLFQETFGLTIYIVNGNNAEKSYPVQLTNFPRGYTFLSGPYLTTYVPTYGNILSLVNFQIINRADIVKVAKFASISPGESQITIYNTMSQQTLSKNVAMVADQNGLPFLYSVAKQDGSFYFEIFDLSINDLVVYQLLLTPIIAMF